MKQEERPHDTYQEVWVCSRFKFLTGIVQSSFLPNLMASEHPSFSWPWIFRSTILVQEMSNPLPIPTGVISFVFHGSQMAFDTDICNRWITRYVRIFYLQGADLLVLTSKSESIEWSLLGLRNHTALAKAGFNFLVRTLKKTMVRKGVEPAAIGFLTLLPKSIYLPISLLFDMQFGLDSK